MVLISFFLVFELRDEHKKYKLHRNKIKKCNKIFQEAQLSFLSFTFKF